MQLDPNLRDGVEEQVRAEYESVFMMYLPRICEHCLNPSCVASCPSGAMYKREEDGIVLVDQEKCRGWRMCVCGCPYKKVYFNWQTGKAEKCTLCYPRIEAGMPTICSETCVGRIRYLGIVLYDADRVEAAASVAGRARTCSTRSSTSSSTRTTRRSASRPGATASPRTGSTPPPLAGLEARDGVADRAAAAPRVPDAADGLVRPAALAGDVAGRGAGVGSADPDDVFPAIDELRIPIEYLANLLSAGDEDVIRDVLKRLAAMRRYMRAGRPRRASRTRRSPRASA